VHALSWRFNTQITVVLLNIFFGIIIDTFGKLRNLKVERELDQANKCFICGVDVHDFVKKGLSTSTDVSFKQHRVERHNLWNYLYFAMHIWQQHRDQDSSVESHVRQCMEAGDISWFPIGVLDNGDDVANAHISNATYGNHHGEDGIWSGNYLNRQGYPDTGDADSNAMREDFEKLSAALSERLGKMQESLSRSSRRNSAAPPPLAMNGSPGFGYMPASGTPLGQNRKRMMGGEAVSPRASGGSKTGQGFAEPSSPRAGGTGGDYFRSPSSPQPNAELLGLITSCIRREMEPFKNQMRARKGSWGDDEDNMEKL
jgi:hypothetical protein